jgi:hypothetical protein
MRGCEDEYLSFAPSAETQPALLRGATAGMEGGEGSMDAKQLRQQLREVRSEMRARGVKRSSFMNGGHSPESYRLNARCFELETQLKRLQAEAVTNTRA